ncbi:ARM repeat-containing protein [Rhizopogon vinicolor AM-OR11-026]|uniref:Vacuolar protein 8 n=1 Tax=Rhizopogon vinicolor AM-OR11-026 TaxID=1314800 RepID=A0A1B7NIX3_9AGAM|nr:ARM repeat-containing protein [Rhizopogon vinicolor AM-OR11-026]
MRPFSSLSSMFMGVVSCCESCFRSRKSQQYEPLLLENEREAVADLLQYLENRTTTNFFQGSPLNALTTLSFSDNVDLQRSAALAFAEITEKEVRPVGRDTLDPILFLLSSQDTEVQRAASAALGNLAVNTDNKLLIVKLGGLEPLIRQMLSPNVEVQCNAVGCFTNLATHDDNKTKIANSGALVPLTRLARSKDMRVQRNATGALLNMTHSDENRQQLVNAGAIPVLVSLLNSMDTDVQYYCTTALSNIAVDAANRKKLAQSEPKLVTSLVALMDSPSLKVQCQAALALRNLASDAKYQLEIVKADGLTSLLRLLQSSYLPLILSSAACVRNVSIHAQNESPIIESGFLQPLINLLSFKDNEEVQCHAISTLRNLAASSQSNKTAIVKAGAVQSIKKLVLDVPFGVQSEMTACIAVLALSDELKGQLLKMGICEVLIPLTNSPSLEVQGNSAAALGNLSSKDSRTAPGDYSAFRNVWKEPNGGMQQYLYNFLKSVDATFQHIAVWTIVQLLESGDGELIRNIRNSALLDAPIRLLASSPTPSAPSSVGTPRSDRSSSRSSAGTHSGEGQGEGQGEIRLLARRILEFVDGDIDGGIPRSVTTSHMGGSSVSSVRDEELRRSVREAFSSGSHH